MENKKQNEFKISTMRTFGGGDQIAYTATIYTEETSLSQEVIDANLQSIDYADKKGFRMSEERNIADKAVLSEFSDIRTQEVKKLDEQMKIEMAERQKATATLVGAEKLSKAIEKVEWESRKNTKNK